MTMCQTCILIRLQWNMYLPRWLIIHAHAPMIYLLTVEFLVQPISFHSRPVERLCTYAR
ncbi:hypothetical protein BDV40DRAFT_262463 [Aspergillus tamarii]|uniref:Uncharacterized protein n=1 Tax=Aspergillus tamarii TaxID=41984 RepID=A0A5N6UY28_ASPTM|nr:hypothetical protein BDV40DRAFT_262463 [Aspergillus tamarii]